jgi:hypothetical protein
VEVVSVRPFDWLFDWLAVRRMMEWLLVVRLGYFGFSVRAFRYSGLRKRGSLTNIIIELVPCWARTMLLVYSMLKGNPQFEMIM